MLSLMSHPGNLHIESILLLKLKIDKELKHHDLITIHRILFAPIGYPVEDSEYLTILQQDSHS